MKLLRLFMVPSLEDMGVQEEMWLFRRIVTLFSWFSTMLLERSIIRSIGMAVVSCWWPDCSVLLSEPEEG